MKKTTLVILAAGMGSRYGGLKQLDPIGPSGEFIIDYSIFDAIRAGFDKIVFIIKEENYNLFHETVGKRVETKIDIAYAFQKFESYTEGIDIPKERTKPLGTAHALLCAKDVTEGNFAVINADDYYGYETFKQLHEFLVKEDDEYKYCMVGFKLSNTLTENGTVSRGVCKTSSDGELLSVTEMTKLKRDEDGIIRNHEGKDQKLDNDTPVSMNCWGFTPDIFESIQQKLKPFFEQHKDDIMKAEFFLPSVVADDIRDGVCHVKVLKTSEKWFGVTYKEDKEAVVRSIKEKIDSSLYPDDLWA